MYDSVTQKPMWKQRGADTFNPFSGSKAKLIWTNPHPTYWASETKINVDLSPYKFIVVQCDTFYNLIDISNFGNVWRYYLSNNGSGYRMVMIDAQGIYVFTGQNRWDYNYNDENVYRTLCVPKFVWGLEESPFES